MGLGASEEHAVGYDHAAPAAVLEELHHSFNKEKLGLLCAQRETIVYVVLVDAAFERRRLVQVNSARRCRASWNLKRLPQFGAGMIRILPDKLPVEGVLDLDARDVLPARDDDVLRARGGRGPRDLHHVPQRRALAQGRAHWPNVRPQIGAGIGSRIRGSVAAGRSPTGAQRATRRASSRFHSRVLCTTVRASAQECTSDS